MRLLFRSLLFFVSHSVRQPPLVRWLILAIVALALPQLALPQSARAEGSASLYPTGYTGNRANIEWRDNTVSTRWGGVLRRRTLLKVYVNPGETILTGSSAVGVGGDVVIYSPGQVSGVIGEETVPAPASAAFRCSDQPGNGRISTRAQELAGPAPNPGGYTPCSFTPATGGVYDVVIYGPSGFASDAGNNPTGSVPDDTANFDANQGSTVAAWDVTVRNGAGATQNGRLFSYYFSAFTGANGRPVNSSVFPVTTDGYEYRTDLRGLDPNGFAILGSRAGFLDTNGDPLYRDVLAATGATTAQASTLEQIQGGVTTARAEFPIFLNRADPQVLTALGITLTPTTPIITALSFAGTASGNTSLINTGGTFSVTVNAPGVLELIISQNGVDFDPTNPNNRVIRRIVSTGNQTIAWDGRDNSGTFFPPNTGAIPNYPVRVRLQSGIYHFPLFDAENSPSGGPSLTLLNPPGAFQPGFTTTTAFYDDRGYRTAAGTQVGTAVNGNLCPPGNSTTTQPGTLFSNPDTGFNSTSGDRAYGTGGGGNTNVVCGAGAFGDAKGLDLWAFFPSSRAETNLVILTSVTAVGTKSVRLVTDTDNSGNLTGGDVVEYTVTYTNPTANPAADFQIADTLPASVAYVPGSLTVTPAGAGTSATANPAFTGTAANPNQLAAAAVLAANGSITTTYRATIDPAATGNIFNQARATSSSNGFPAGGVPTDATTPPGSISQTPYPNNGNADPTGLTVQPRPPRLFKSVRWLRDNDNSGNLTIGDDVQYTLTVTNPNPGAAIPGVVVSEIFPVQLQILVGGANPIATTGGLTIAASFPTANFNGTGTPPPVTITDPATLPANGQATIVYNARILPGAASPIANQARANYTGDNGTPVTSDASDSTNPAAPGSGAGTPGTPGTLGTGGNVTQPNANAADPTIISFVPPQIPAGTKSVRLAIDADGSGSLTTGDTVEYTVTYSNPGAAPIANFRVTDSLNPALVTFVAGSYVFSASAGTTVPANPGFNGTSDSNLTGAGTLAGNGQVVTRFRAVVTAAANTQINNQATGTSDGNPPVPTDAIAAPADVPQILGGNADPTVFGVGSAGTPRLRLLKRITNVTRGGSPIAGVVFGQVITDAAGDATAIQQAGLPPLGVLEVPVTSSLQSGDEVEYTVYFLSDGGSAVLAASLCDAIPTLTSLVSNTPSIQRGTAATVPGGTAFAALAPLPPGNACPDPANPNGAVIFDLGTIPTIAGNNVGFVRFRVRIN